MNRQFTYYHSVDIHETLVRIGSKAGVDGRSTGASQGLRIAARNHEALVKELGAVLEAWELGYTAKETVDYDIAKALLAKIEGELRSAH